MRSRGWPGQDEGKLRAWKSRRMADRRGVWPRYRIPCFPSARPASAFHGFGAVRPRPSRAGALQPTGASIMFIRSVEFFRPRRIGTIPALALAAIAGLAISPARVGADGYPNKFNFGEAATEQDIASIAIAIPADGKGLP